MTVHVTIAAVWLFTLPLTIARFNLVSPVGFFVNVVLAPLVVVILWCGYTLLLVGLVAAPLAAPFAFGFDVSLRLMLWLDRTDRGNSWRPHVSARTVRWLSSPASTLAWRLSRLDFRRGGCAWWGWRAMLIWIVGGLGSSLWPHRADELRCTFLSVGHGLAVVVELPGGRTLVYDAGQMQDGSRARQTVQGALWQRGVRSIDALVISHADIDHFNGVPGLARTVSIGSVLVHESFLDFRQLGVEKTCEVLARRGVPIKLIRAGDQVNLDSQVKLTVLHPTSSDRLPTDNANSIVLEIEYAGRRILLTGDLERDGLEYLLRQSPRHIDIFLAPHHGRVAANPRRLAEWANPDWVIVSDGRQDSSERSQGCVRPGGTCAVDAAVGCDHVFRDRQAGHSPMPTLPHRICISARASQLRAKSTRPYVTGHMEYASQRPLPARLAGESDSARTKRRSAFMSIHP